MVPSSYCHCPSTANDAIGLERRAVLGSALVTVVIAGRDQVKRYISRIPQYLQISLAGRQRNWQRDVFAIQRSGTMEGTTFSR